MNDLVSVIVGVAGVMIVVLTAVSAAQTFVVPRGTPHGSIDLTLELLDLASGLVLRSRHFLLPPPLMPLIARRALKDSYPSRRGFPDVGSGSRRAVGSSVAKSLFSARTPAEVRRFIKVDLPALV